ncbi:glycosyltransferase [Paraflavitalea sp. CAU 1676]|uniref:glycosyltransferase n=1 Tax=Paraflavitalea sp. CAU 1676 TaxID=3032598 RepID=UPI0023DBFA69|nr:glycosyltransferase [Paraflavitalea sp. CAU 1676]MDF2187574.1 glycosyltransferase [Paraflavitalea sp. CAU 1676]
MAFLSLVNWWQVLFYVFCLVALIQLLYYWIIFQKLAWYKPAEKVQSQTYAVSVIICARDEAANLAKNLPGVLVQTYPSTHEVIVVNHNSQDETRYLLEEFRKTFKNLHIVNLEQEAKGIPGKKYPLSIGIKEAHHEILLLTDADCVPASENWMQKMQYAYGNGTEVVLGYGAYHKQPGILNKLIRFETFHAALQYLSFALAGLPYMGVGRNLSYKKGLFFANKGFSSINHVLSGDDDLFINRVANKHNTSIMIDEDAITLSAPKKTFGDWWRQKNRHFTTGKFYKPVHRFLLGLYGLTHFLFYPLLILSAIFFDWRISLGIFLIRCISQGIIYKKSMEKLNEKDLFAWWWLLDIWMFIYYCIFAPALWKKPKKNWH